MNEPTTVYGEAAVHLLSTTMPRPNLVLGSVEFTIGGPAAVVSLQMAKLGHPPRFVGLAGDDPAGLFVRDELERVGVDCTELAGRGRTTRVIAVTENGTVALAAEPGVQWSAGPWYKQPPPPRNGAYITGFPDLVSTIQDLGRRGHRMVVDVGFVPLLARPEMLLQHVAAIGPAIEVCVVSGASLARDTREAITRVCFDNGATVVLTTLAADGVLVATPHTIRHLPVRKVAVRDLLCAGDVFVAGYLCAVREGSDPFEAAEFGQAVAATKIGMFGGFPDRAHVGRRPT